MKVGKFAKTIGDLLKMMSDFDLRTSDWKYIDLYSEFVKNKQNHIKYNTNIFILSEKYNISESSVKRLIRRFEREMD